MDVDNTSLVMNNVHISSSSR